MKAIFLDRDGVINKYPGDFQYVRAWNEFHFLPQALPALKKLNAAGYKIFVISNQAGVAKKIYSQADLDLITANMLAGLRNEGIEIEGVFYCTHLPDDNCECRKPKAGLVHKAVAALKQRGEGIDFSKSYFIGDSEMDVQTGMSVGLKTILVFSGRERPENRSRWKNLPDFTAMDLYEAAEMIVNASPDK
ncbi:MAG: HAD family hydrolase [Candidatus Omnitrophota bacterium]